MIAKEILIKAIKRSKEERGLRISRPNEYLSGGHIKKADHNLVVMTDLGKLGHEDWVVITAYYAMYHSVLSLLSRIGLESKDHATTAAVLECFFGEQINKEWILIFNEIKDRKEKIEALTIEERYINYLWKMKRARETVQYGISISYKEIDTAMKSAREFVSKMKLVSNELDERLIGIIDRKVKELTEEATK